MNCPYCSSEHAVPTSGDEVGERFHCQNCGENFHSYPEDESEFSPCYIGDHDWKEISYPNGEAYAICNICGLIDD